MISPFEIYAVMQLDNVHTSLDIILGVGIAFVIAGGTALVMIRETLEALAHRYCIGAVVVLSMVLVFKTLLPSSTTAAAMIILPKIANNESVQAETREFYDLAKQGLESLVAPDESK